MAGAWCDGGHKQHEQGGFVWPSQPLAPRASGLHFAVAATCITLERFCFLRVHRHLLQGAGSASGMPWLCFDSLQFMSSTLYPQRISGTLQGT